MQLKHLNITVIGHVQGVARAGFHSPARRLGPRADRPGARSGRERKQRDADGDRDDVGRRGSGKSTGLLFPTHKNEANYAIIPRQEESLNLIET